MGGYNPCYSGSYSDIFEVDASIQDKYDEKELSKGDSGSCSNNKNDLSKSTFSEKMLASFLSNVFVYIEALFRDYTREYESLLKKNKGILQFQT